MSIEKLKLESNLELQQLITEDVNKVERNLTLICNNIPINDKTTIDILCHDDNGQLVIIQLSVSEDDLMLLQGVQSLDYVNKFKSFLKATYNKHKIDDNEKPRLILIAPGFSDALRHAVEIMSGVRVDLYEWEYLKLGDHKGLRLQPIFGWKQEEKSREERPAEKKRETRSSKKKEPELESTPEPEPLKVEPEAPEEAPAFPEPSPEEPKEEPESFPPEKVPPKRKLKLF
jgi:hypothetical protein